MTSCTSLVDLVIEINGINKCRIDVRDRQACLHLSYKKGPSPGSSPVVALKGEISFVNLMQVAILFSFGYFFLWWALERQ